MEIKYSISKRKAPGQPASPAKWYATIHHRGTLDLDDIIKEILFRGSVYDREDIVYIFAKFTRHAKELLLEGYRLRLDGLGTLFLTCHSNGATTKGAFTHKNIQTLDLKLSSSESFKEMLQRVKLKRGGC